MGGFLFISSVDGLISFALLLGCLGFLLRLGQLGSPLLASLALDGPAFVLGLLRHLAGR
jgi:hypothetical protein